jgi:hypothetical protein
MRVCLLTTDDRHSSAGEHIAALADEIGDATVVRTGTADWPDAQHVDELSGSFDAAIAFGWQACLHVFRVDARAYAQRVPALEEAQFWHGDERRLLAALTYDLPLTLIAPNRAVAAELEDSAPGRNVVVVEPGVRRDALDAAPARRGDSGALRVATASPAEEILARASEPVEHVALGDADVLLALADSPLTLTYVAWAQLAGAVPIVTPVAGHDELVTDGESGLVVGFDDVPGTARAIDTLARDRGLLAKLSEGARKRAGRFPAIADEAKAILDAVAKPAAADGWPSRLLLNARAVAEPIAQERRALDAALRSYEERIQALSEENESLRAQLDEQARAYRVGKKLEPLWGPAARVRRKK